jgi:uncharacterized membrane protein (UPF0127 family)
MKQKVGFSYKGKKIFLEVERVSFLGRIRGLMFRRREKAFPLLFEFKISGRRAIHSLFVFFPFLALWLDDKNRVISSEIVSPGRFSVCPKKSFFRLIEVPLNSKYYWILRHRRGTRKI